MATILVFLPLLVTLTLIGGLVVFAARIAQAPGTTAARLVTLSFVLALIGSLCLVFWPLSLASGVSVNVSVDPSTGQTISSSEQHWTVTWFPNIRQYGASLMLIALIPVVLTAAPVAWQRLGLPKPRAVRVASSVGLLVWLVAGGLAALSWWSYPATVTVMVAASRRT